MVLRYAVLSVLFACLTNVTPAFASTSTSLTQPTNGATVSGLVSISLSAGSGVQWSNFYIDGNYYASTPPSSITWDSTKVPNGTHTISATAYSASKAVMGTASVSVSVANSSALQLTSPLPGSQVGGTITIAANRPSGVAWENFYLDGGWIASTPPYSFSWNTAQVGNGSHTISVIAYGSSGSKLGAYIESFVVSNLTKSPPASIAPTPTVGATAVPTVAPTLVPTNVPTSIPTVAPTAVPTVAPTAIPTIAPTAIPTIAPTPIPTVVPTTVPTAAATPVPTAVPTSQPAISMLVPANNSIVSGTINVAVQQNSSAVSWVNFHCDGRYITSSPPMSITWDSTTMPDGQHVLSATAYGTGSVNLGSASTNIMVANAANPTATATAKSTAAPSASPTPVGVELRPTNQIPNSTMPIASELSAFHSGVGACGGLDTCSYMQQVDGQFTGTTTAIIEHEADKWCPNCTILNPLDGLTYSFRDLAKAIAVNETNWHQWRSANLTSPDPVTGVPTLTPSHGDLENVSASEPFAGSWGIFQIAEGSGQGWPSSYPLSAKYTAFNADFKLAEQMGVEQGHLNYLGDPSGSITAIGNGYPPYVNYTDANGVLHPASADTNVLRWGAVGNWFSGGWYDSGALQYIQQVQQILHNQPWTQPGF